MSSDYQDYLSEKDIFIATPCYGGMATAVYVTSLTQFCDYLGRNSVNYTVSMLTNESLVTRARNKLVADFLKTDCTHLFFIDADIEFNYSDAVRAILHDKDVVVGSYPVKSYDFDKAVNQKFSSKEQILEAITTHVINFSFNSDEDRKSGKVKITEGLIEVLDAGTGFMCIKREVFERMIDAYPETKYTPEGTTDTVYALFDTMIYDDRYLSEDYAFCRRWQAIGGKIHLDPITTLNHYGTVGFYGVPTVRIEKTEQK